MRNYKILTLVFISVICISISCKTKKVEKTSINTENFTTSPEIREQLLSVFPDKIAEFPGGDAGLQKFIQKNLQYPPEAAKIGIQGRTLCRFIVHEDGSISDIEIIHSIDPLFDKEAIRLVKSFPRWKPAQKDGKNMKMFFTIPFLFKLENKPIERD